MTDFQDRLRQAVNRSNRSPREISLAAGVSPGTISELLRDPDRSPSVKNLQAVAQELGVSFVWLTEGTEAGTPPRGFAMSVADPWEPKPSGERPDLHTPAEVLIKAVTPRARRGSTWRAKASAPLFGILTDDVLIVDLKRAAREGDIVLATVADLVTGAARTVLRKLATPYLLSPDPADKQAALVVDGVRTAVMGPVIAVLRSGDLVEV